jgi:adenylate cyclase
MRDFERWIVNQGLYGSNIAELLEGIADHLVADGVSLQRAYLALPTLNPYVRVLNHTWRRGGKTVVEGIEHGRDTEAFRISPFNYMQNEGLVAHRWRLNTPEGDAFALFASLKLEGATDYLARMVSFKNSNAPALRGIALSFTTDAPEGFSAEQIDRIDAILPLASLAAYRIALLDLAIGVLDTYVGLSAGRRVLSGEIHRGSGETLTAALLFADLRNFTASAETGGQGLITRLDEHLEAITEPVTAHGGEILKFLGDGVLAAFLITDEVTRDAACKAAVQAAMGALRGNRIVNQRHAKGDGLDLDVALHCGEVFYGNIGGPGRLDFTVIGPTVNEVSRIEALCSVLDCPLLLSPPVALACGYPVRSLGHRSLRGVAEEKELFTLAELVREGESELHVASLPDPRGQNDR